MTHKKLIDERYRRKVEVLKKKQLSPSKVEREAWKFELSCLCLGAKVQLSEEETEYISKLRTQLSGDVNEFYLRLFK